MRLLSAVASGSVEFAMLWAEAKHILVGYVIPIVVSIGIIRIIQVIFQQIKRYFVPEQSAASQEASEQKAN